MTEVIGRYECIRTIGKGGMGEVLLAKDPICEREVALKRIRPDLRQHVHLRNRFIREAKITAGLTHPGIISIFSIHEEGDETYYTMPYVEGETFREILRAEIQNHKETGSIPALLPIFKSLCQTVAYAHSRGIIHRDLKPENILVGRFGEVIILDWGLAQIISEPPEELEDVEIPEAEEGLTRPGKLVGTVAFMAPERALGAPATIQTDIYALGVILYQILTLRFPFNRTSLKEFRSKYKLEKFLDPEDVAPYRDVPPRLSSIVKKSLEANPAERYQTVEELIHDLMGHMEGRSEWFESARLDIRTKKHWEFQENVLVARHIAVTQAAESSDWVSMMVSKSAFADNTRIETRIRLGESCAGIGFLLSVPGAAEREHPLEGYCLWIGAKDVGSMQLYRNIVEVVQFGDLALERGAWHTLAIEKIDTNIHFFLDGQRCFTYLSYLPLFGTHIGLIARDADFEMEEIVVSIGSQNITVSCLSIPDAFLASKDYKRALAEYRRIGYSFPGHAEGREALFRAGITLLEQARTARTEKKSETHYTAALEEFAKLHNTPGAPLEYLGKALVYQSLRDYAEEIKCLELGLRRYNKHPLINVIREQILYRMHESAQTDRRSAYQLILIALRLLPSVVQNSEAQRLFSHLINNWERLPFFESAIDPSLLCKEKSSEIRFATALAFWLSAPYILQELFHRALKEKELDYSIIGDMIYALYELGSHNLAFKLSTEAKAIENPELKEILELFHPLHLCQTRSLADGYAALRFEEIGVREFRTISYLLQFALRTDQEEFVHTIAERIQNLPLSKEDRIQLDAYRCWAYLKEENWQETGRIFETYPLELLNQEGTLLHPIYGCYLLLTEGEEIAKIHFAGVIDTPFPRSWALLGHELTNKITESPSWYSTSFMWERRHLNQQLTLYYQCSENPELESFYRMHEREDYISVSD